MDLTTEQEINRMVDALQNMATKEFADVKSSEPFETHVSSGDDSPEHAKLIGKGVQLGLHDHFGPERVSVEVVKTGYLIRIQRA